MQSQTDYRAQKHIFRIVFLINIKVVSATEWECKILILKKWPDTTRDSTLV